MPAPQVPDGFELVSNGTARLTVDGQMWRLRRPKLGEFRKLRELLHERDDERLRIIGRQKPDEPLAEDAGNEEKTERLLTVNRRARQLNDEVNALNVAWLAEALTMLADKEPPPADEWPSGMDSSDTIAELVQHWRSVPLRSGGS